MQEAGKDFLVGKTVADIGCGTGETTSKMQEVAQKVMGFDPKLSMIAQALKTYPNSYFIQSSAEDFNLEAECDCITSFFCLQWVEDKPKVFANFFRALKDGGKILVTLATKEEKSVVEEVVKKLFMLSLKRNIRN